MKQSLLLVALFFTISYSSKAFGPADPLKDSTKLYQLFLLTYPSSILLGDFSLGAEFSYKRFRQEVAVFYKTYSAIPKIYYYDEGFGFNYYLKYSFLKEKGFLMSLDAGYVFRKAFYDNKVVPMGRNDYGTPVNQYNTDRLFTKSGLSIGISNLMRVGNRLYVGMNACVDFVFVNHHFVVKEYISGQKLIIHGNPDQELATPFIDERKYKGLSATLLFKVAYAL